MTETTEATQLMPRHLFIRQAPNEPVAAEIWPTIKGARIVSLANIADHVVVELCWENMQTEIALPAWMTSIVEQIGTPANIMMRFAFPPEHTHYLQEHELLPSEREHNQQ